MSTEPSEPSAVQVFRMSAPALLSAGRLLKLPIFAFGVQRPLRKVTVSVQIRHETGGMLSLALAGPDGAVVALAAVGGDTQLLGESVARPLVFDDDADRTIAESAAPFAGAHRPQQTLGVFRHPGRRLNGMWHLLLSDSGGGKARTLVANAALTFRS